MTGKQRAIELIKAGKTDAEVAEETGLARKTVSNYRRALSKEYRIQPKTVNTNSEWAMRFTLEWDAAVNQINRYFGCSEGGRA